MGVINIKKLGIILGIVALFFAAKPILADVLPAITFESPYTTGNINGQQGWLKTGPYHSEVVSVSGFSNASAFGFQTQALRIDNAITSGAFGDQTFSPGLAEPAGETVTNNHFEASFSIGSTLNTQQLGLFLSVSPDDGNGSRMAYVGFGDQPDGINVITYDVTDPGYGTVATWTPYTVATLNRTSAHTVKFVIDFLPGPANDVVKLYVDNTLVHTGPSWEDYYRYDPEQNGNGHQLFPISKLLFRVGGDPATGTNGNGYLIDNVSLMSSYIAPTPQKVNICHLEKKNSTNFHLISIDEDAVPAHLKHGDLLPGVNISAGCKVLTGKWLLSVNNNTYRHDMFIDSISPTGAITGHGGYPAGSYLPGYSWKMTGQLTGSNISLTLVYDNGYTATITGIVNSDGNGIAGGPGTGGVFNWTASR